MTDGIPATMTVVAISRPGGPEVLQPETRPVPRPGPGEVLVRVHAAGVNRPDMMQRRGFYPPPPGAPDIPGLEFAGEVVAAGPGAERHRIAAAVTALVPGGGYAEYAVVHEDNALPLPRGLTMAEAAAIPETFFTVWSNVFDHGRLESGETLLVHGGTSGIGTTAIQLAVARGAQAFATAGSDDKCAACLRLGAAAAINYRTQDFVEEVERLTDGRGVDVILDMVGGTYVDRNIDASAEDGRIMQISTLQGVSATIDVRRLMQKRVMLTGSTLRPRPVPFKAGIARSLYEHVWPLIEAGRVRPLIDSTFTLANAADAHRRIEADHIGKIVLKVVD